jgi:hypothetical protein
MTPDEARLMILERLRQGQGRGSILRALGAAGVADAARLYSRVRVEWLQSNLPAALRAAARRHVAIGIPLLVVSLGVCAFAVWFGINAAGEDKGVPGAVKMGLSGAFALVFSAGELLWAGSRFRRARRLEEEPPSSGG